MDSFHGFIYAVGWFLIRFGIPILATIALCYFFKKLDARWQAEGEAYRKKAGIELVKTVVPCWVINNCPEDKKEKCPAYQDKKIPCWQQFRSRNGELQERCIGCGVFRASPVPVIGD